MFENSRFRAEALKALRGHWQTALLVMLTASAPTLLAGVIRQLLTAGAEQQLYRMISNGNTDALLDPAVITGLLPVSTQILILAMSLAAPLAAAPFGLGAWHYDADLLRGQTPLYKTVFSRLFIFLKSISLEIITALKVFLWGLPGAVLMAGVVWLMPVTESDPNSAVRLVMNVVSVGVLLTAVPMIVAALRYSMAQFVLAERPDTRVMDCVAQSKSIMRQRKGQFFMLLLSFAIWLFMLMMLDQFFATVFGDVIATTVYMFLNLALNTYMSAACVRFFLEYDERGFVLAAKADHEPGTVGEPDSDSNPSQDNSRSPEE